VNVNVEPTLIFDYRNWFLPALNNYALHSGPEPSPYVYLLIGSEKKLSDIDESVPIYATVASCRALQDLKNVTSLMVCLLQKIFIFSLASTSIRCHC